VDFATDASQKKFSTNELSLHKKDISQENEEENIRFFTFILYHRAVVKQDHYMVLLLSYAVRYANSNATVM
jgi:hypothetical protein